MLAQNEKLPIQDLIQRRQEDPKKLEIKTRTNKWTNHFKQLRQNDEEVEFQNDIRTNLNKLTPDNYLIIRELLVEKVQNSREKCEFLTKKIIEKAWNEQKYTKVYAELCSFLQNSKKLEEIDSSTPVQKAKKRNLFKKALFEQIQALFEEEIDENSLKNDENSDKLTIRKKFGSNY